MTVQTDPAAVAPIRTEDLRKTFHGTRGDVKAVDGIDLVIREGEFFGLLGPNGAGKSTMIGMLTTRVIPTGGRAYIAGIDVVAHPAAAKVHIGVVAQTNTLDRQLTVRENLEFHGRYFGMSRKDATVRADGLLEQFRLADRAKASVHELSGGMAQRLMVARALVHRPAILFLDEPTSGIDPQSRLALWEVLRELHAANQTILLTTHYMEEADALCERLAIIDHGRLLALGTPAELKQGLGAETVLTLTFADDCGALQPKIEKLAAVDHVERSDDTLRVYAGDADGLLAQIVTLATKAKVHVTEASSQPPSLEAVFLSLTGQDLRE